MKEKPTSKASSEKFKKIMDDLITIILALEQRIVELEGKIKQTQNMSDDYDIIIRRLEQIIIEQNEKINSLTIEP